MDKSNLGDRMKGYEGIPKIKLTKRTPVVIRLDGKAFHTLTRGMNKPFDSLLMETMQETAKYLCENIQGCKLAYTQSDEITLLLTDYEKLTTDAWFDYSVQKMVSISASMATLAFNKVFRGKVEDFELNISLFRSLGYSHGFEIDKLNDEHRNLLAKIDKALFDSRVFSLSKEEVCNCFIWRQQDCTKNSISMVAQAYFSHNELHKKTGAMKQDMLMLEKGVNWNDFTPSEKRGTCVIKKISEVEGIVRNKWTIDLETPIFSKDRAYIEDLL